MVFVTKYNKYLIVICAVILASMWLIKSMQIRNESIRSENINNTRIEPTENIKSDSVIDNILIKDDENKTIVLKKKSKEEVLASRPYISAESYIVGNLETGEIYISLNSNKASPIASLSKLYTALIAHHFLNKEDKITITENMLSAYGDAGHLSLGEIFTVYDLLYPLLIESSNDASEAYAQYVGYENFIDKMNGFAGEIDMNSTHFKDASGLSPSNISTAHDLFALARYLYKNEREILDISKQYEMELPKTDEHNSHKFTNINPYSNYADFIGGKTGRTDSAKETMISLFDQEVKGIKYPVAVILLRSNMGEREIDTEKLLGKFIDQVSKK